jgi:hypothetical protein
VRLLQLWFLAGILSAIAYNQMYERYCGNPAPANRTLFVAALAPVMLTIEALGTEVNQCVAP